MKNSLIIRVHDANVQTYELNKLVGNTPLSSFVDLINIADLEANPREAKKGSVTEDIEESLETEPEIFHFMTKGVLVAARSVEQLERGRYRITFEDPQLEGILDGGHNTLAIGRYILQSLLDNGADFDRSVRRWEDLKEAWAKHLGEIAPKKKDLEDIRIPIEIIYPGDGDGAEEYFQDKILRINAARNNNVQLTEETKAHKKGLYEEIKKNLDSALQKDVEWKANAGGRIKARDLIALSLIPLSKLPDDLPTNHVAENPTIIFAQKGQCVKLFNELLEDTAVVEQVKGEIVEIKHSGVRSALRLMADIPRLYDLIYKRMPEAYKKVSYRFGGMNCVRVWAGPEKYKENKKKYLPKPARTKFYQEEVTYDYPDGFIYPIVYGLTALMEYKGGKVQWKTDPAKFIMRNLDKVMKSYWSIIQGQNYDPAKVGKATGAYTLVVTLFDSALNEELIEKLRSEGKLPL